MSSCVESGFDAHSTNSAPPAFSVSARFAVSDVTWRQPAILTPFSGLVSANRSRIPRNTGISCSAHCARNSP